jgi:hypothetical protein
MQWREFSNRQPCLLECFKILARSSPKIFATFFSKYFSVGHERVMVCYLDNSKIYGDN